MYPCYLCGGPTTTPKYNLTNKQKAERRCPSCRYRRLTPSVITHYALVPTPEAYQVILGSLFGDGGLESRPGGASPSLSIKHGPKQHAYARWKAALLGDFVSSVRPAEKVKLRVRTKTHPLFAELNARWHESDASFQGLLSELDDLGWAILYLDDGNYAPEHVRTSGYTEKATVRISTASFSDTRVALTQATLEARFGVETTMCSWRRLGEPDRPYHGVRLYAEHALKFLARLKPLIPLETGMLYKFAS